MKPSLQKYFEDIVARQSSDIKRFILKNGLLDIEEAFKWMAKSEIDCIENGYKNNIEIHGHYIFIKLRRNYRKSNSKQSIIKNNEGKQPEKDFENKLENLGTSIITQTDFSDSLNLFNECYEQLSVRARNVLEYNKINRDKTFFDAIRKDDFSFINLKNCGKKTARELSLMAEKMKEHYQELVFQETDEGSDFPKIIISSIKILQLSKRTYNCLKAHEIETIRDLVSFREEDILKFRNLGKKSISELKLILASMNLQFGMTFEEDVDNEKNVLESVLWQFSEYDRNFAIFFKEKHGHLPLVYLSCKRAIEHFTEYEGIVFKSYYGLFNPQLIANDNINHILKIGLSPYSGERPNSLSIEEIAQKTSLTVERIRQILLKAQKRFLGASELLHGHEDWQFYGVRNLPLYLWELDSSIQENLVLEENESVEYALNAIPSSEIIDFLKEKPIIDEHLFKVFLQRYDMKAYWIDKDKRSVSPYFSRDDYFSFKSTRSVPPQRPILLMNKRLKGLKLNKAIREVKRLYSIKTEQDVFIPLKSYFLDNPQYCISDNLTDIEKDAVVELMVKLFESLCEAQFKDHDIYVKANTVDYGEMLYDILKKSGTKVRRDELFIKLYQICKETGIEFAFSDSSQILRFLTKNPSIVPYGKSSYWGLKEWGYDEGSIREIAISLVKRANEPIHIDELTRLIMKYRPDSNEKSISSVIRQTTSSGELLLFYDDLIGFPNKKYDDTYIIMPQSFDDWLQALRKYIMDNKRFPYSRQGGFEGYLFRWYYRSRQLTTLTPNEILKLDNFEKEFTHYPHNTTEYTFLQYCNLYKAFVEKNKRKLTFKDDADLYNWFYLASHNSNTFNDNRTTYFNKLLQTLSAILY